MPTYIPEEIVEKLRNLSIESVAWELGITVKRHTALCFNHDDHHPSMVFNVTRNSFRCYVCDGLYGGPINLVQSYLNLNFVDACLWLGNRFGIFIPDAPDVPAQVPVKRKPVEKKVVKPTVEMDLEVLETLVNGLSLSGKGLEFLTKERMYDLRMMSRLNICSASDDKEILSILTQHYPLERLLKCKLVFQKEGRMVSYFHAPCLFFPYYGEDGRLLSLQARYLGDREEFPRFQFPMGAKPSVFNLRVLNFLKEDEPLYISEGVTDCLALLSDRKKAVAIPSATSLHVVNVEHLAKHPLFMYPDQDEPGMRLFTQLQEEVEKMHGTLTRLELPSDCKDFSGYYVKMKKLKAVRLSLAKCYGVPAYNIFFDRCIPDLISEHPSTLAELTPLIQKFGKIDLQEFGEEILKVIKSF